MSCDGADGSATTREFGVRKKWNEMNKPSFNAYMCFNLSHVRNFVVDVVAGVGLLAVFRRQ